jgi:hypothetical protein
MGRSIALPPVPEGLLAEGFRRALLEFLVKARAIPDELRSRLLGWRHFGGFSVHNQVRLGGHDAEGRKSLAGYMLRAPMSLEKMRYDAATGSVIHRSKMHLGLKRNFQVMPGAARPGPLSKHPVRLRRVVFQPRAHFPIPQRRRAFSRQAKRDAWRVSRHPRSHPA